MSVIRDKASQQNQPEVQAWKKPQLNQVGDLAEVIRSGGGKLTLAGGDPGENRKPRGGGG
jgi:hypothetical protein